MEVPPSMGVATAINFQPTGGGKAAITGDFVMTADEVNPVIRARNRYRRVARAAGALAGRETTRESSRLFFMHFWANDDAIVLAAGCARPWISSSPGKTLRLSTAGRTAA